MVGAEVLEPERRSSTACALLILAALIVHSITVTAFARHLPEQDSMSACAARATSSVKRTHAAPAFYTRK